MMRMKIYFLLIALFVGVTGARAASQIVPPQPLPFATVNLRTSSIRAPSCRRRCA
jgi:hypothetical protein